MAEFSISFVVDGKRLGDLLMVLHQFKVSNLDMHPVVRKGAIGRAGGEPTWMAVTKWVIAQKRPILPHEAFAFVESIGSPKTSVYSYLSSGAKAKLLRKTAKGYIGVIK